MSKLKGLKTYVVTAKTTACAAPLIMRKYTVNRAICRRYKKQYGDTSIIIVGGEISSAVSIRNIMKKSAKIGDSMEFTISTFLRLLDSRKINNSNIYILKELHSNSIHQVTTDEMECFLYRGWVTNAVWQ